MSDLSATVPMYSALGFLPLLLIFNLELAPGGAFPVMKNGVTRIFAEREGKVWWVLPLLFAPAAALTQFAPTLCPEDAPLSVFLGIAALATFGVLLLWWGLRLLQEFRRAPHKKALLAWGFVTVPLILGQVAYQLNGRWKLVLLRLWVVIVVMALCEVNVGFRRQRRELLDAKEAAARSRLSPHFLLNTLNALHAQIEKDPGGAQATTEQLGGMFRQLLVLARRPVVRLSEEVEFVEALLGLHKARLGERLNVDLDIPEATLACELPTLALQTLVENAIQHGVAARETGGVVKVTARLELTRMGGFGSHPPVPTDAVVTKLDVSYPAWTHLVLSVENPVPEHASPSSGTGTGLGSLRARLRQPEDLRIEEGDGVFRASIRWMQG